MDDFGDYGVTAAQYSACSTMPSAQFWEHGNYTGVATEKIAGLSFIYIKIANA